MKKRLFPILLLLTAATLTAQVSVNQDNSAPDPSAMLDVKSSDKGLLIPRMTSAQRDAIASPTPGLIIYNTQDSCFNYYTGTAWVKDCGRNLEADQEIIPTVNPGGTGCAIGKDIDVDAAGNRYVTGRFQGTVTFGSTTLISTGIDDVFLVKYSPSSEVLWAVQAGGADVDSGNGISVDPSGNCYVTGSFLGTATFGNSMLTSAGESDLFIAKFDPDGQMLWVQQAGGADFDDGIGISFDAVGNCYVTGNFIGAATFGNIMLTSAGFNDVFVAKFDPDGQILWAKQAGGTGNDGGKDIIVDPTGNSYVAGHFQGTATFGNISLTSVGGIDVFVAKLDADGQMLWVQQAGGPGTDAISGISIDAAGNNYVTGSFSDTAIFGDTTLSSAGSFDVFITKYSPSGQFQWAVRAGGANFDIGADIDVDANGNSYVTGIFQGAGSFGGYPLTSAGQSDVFAAKLDPSGQIIWAKQAGGDNDDHGNGICVDATGNSYVTGSFDDTATFGNTTLTSSGICDLFLWALNPDNGGTAFLDNTNFSASQDLDPDPTNELQDISLNGNQLSITNGSTVELPPGADNLGDHIATQNILLNGNYLSGDGDNEGIAVDADGRAGIGTGAPDPSAMLDVKSSDKGLLIPRMTSAERDAISNPAAGLIIYNTQDSCFNYYTGAAWVKDCGRSLEADQEIIPTIHVDGTGYESGEDIDVDAAGNKYVIGRFNGTVTFGNTTLNSTGSYDIFLAKYGPSGEVLWAIQAGGGDIDSGNGVSVDAAGNCYVTGSFGAAATFGNIMLTSAGNDDVFVAKFDPDGQMLWVQQAGGTGLDYGSGISIDGAGNAYVTGSFGGTATFGNTMLTSAGGSDVFVAKLDPDGQMLWAKQAGGTSADGGSSINADAAGNSYVTGYFHGTATFGNSALTSAGGSDVFVAKLDPDGQMLWVQQAGGSGNDQGRGICVDAAGNNYVTGNFIGTAVFSGTTLTSSGSIDVFVTQYTPSGQLQWAVQAGGVNIEVGQSIDVDLNGNSYVTGFFQGASAFGGNPLTPAGQRDIFAAKFDPSGQIVWALGAGGPGIDDGLGICVDATGNSYVTGFFNSTATFGNTTLTSSGFDDVYLWVLNPDNGGAAFLDNFNLAGSQDHDTDPTNELQELSLSGTTLGITNGNSVDISDNDWTLSGNNLYNANSGFVGIGTASPKQRLHVNGQYYGRGQMWLHANEGDGSSGTAYVQARDDSGTSDIGLRLRTQSAGNLVEAVHLTPDGNIGIGTTLPKQTLHVNGQYYGRGQMWLHANEGDGNSGTAYVQARDDSGTSDIGLRLRTQSAGNLVEAVHLTPDGKVGINTTTPDNQFSVSGHADFTGNVGIGTVAPKAPLHVNGQYYGRGQMWLHANEGDGNSGTAFVQARDDSGTSDIGLQLRSQNAGSQVNAVYVAPDGKVGVGTTDPGDRAFRVVGSSEQDGKVYYTSALRTAAFFGFDIVCWNEGGGKYEVGRVVSSRRYKDNIQPFDPGAERLLDIQLKSWTQKGDSTGQLGIGYIAEEVDSLGLKDLVLYREDGVVESLRFSYFPFYNLEIIKHNRARIVALEDELSAMTQENEALKAQVAKQEAQTAAMQAAFEQRFQQLEAALQQLNNTAGKSQAPNEK